jgi:hypothetical protein
MNCVMLAIRQGLEVKKIAARHVPGLTLSTGYSLEPSYVAFTMPQVPPPRCEASSPLPWHIDPSQLSLTASSDLQMPIQPSFSPAHDDSNEIFNPDFSMKPSSHPRRADPEGNVATMSQSIQNAGTGSQNRLLGVSYQLQSGFQGDLRGASIPIASTSSHSNFSAQQTMHCGIHHTSCREGNVAGPSETVFHSSDAQYTASTDNFGAGEPFQYNLEPDSVEALLEAEVSAACFRAIGHIGKADTV